ncbi:MAG: DEAD/DEAH box helicase [Chitinophagales bacterium]|jgi:ATP-dependent RNA helicase DeaD|nr:DEAD/DEAH box helicase [Chitinophagales bacterium]
MNFKELGLSQPILKALDDLNFIEPTPIQAQAIPYLLAHDTDLMGLAQTGTGKTAAFGLPLLHKIDIALRRPQALILCPTRELCLQITNDLVKYTKYMPELQTVAVYGGAAITNQIRDIRRGAQIIVATPGRMKDIINRGEIKFDMVDTVILDEADEMLNMGFQESIDDILSYTKAEKNTWLFTATMPAQIKRISKKYMRNPFEIAVSVNTSNENIEHQYTLVAHRDKYAALKRIVDFYPDIFAIVFCRTKNDAKEIADKLIKDGYNSDALHGDLTQQQRDVVMGRYREKSLQILVATDVAARGIDVKNVTHVIHYGLPDDIENYTHRSGRTARAGETGISIGIIAKMDIPKIYAIEKIIEKRFTKINVPTGMEVLEKQLIKWSEKIKSVQVNQSNISKYIEQIQLDLNDMTKEDIISRFMSLEFNNLFAYYREERDLNLSVDSRRSNEPMGKAFRAERTRNSDGPGSFRQVESGFTRFFINLGSMDRIKRNDILRVVCDSYQIKGMAIGKIDLKEKFSFFEVESTYKNKILTNIKESIDFNGKRVNVELAGAAPTQKSFTKSNPYQKDSSDATGFTKKSYSSGSTFSKSKERKRPKSENLGFTDYSI